MRRGTPVTRPMTDPSCASGAARGVARWFVFMMSGSAWWRGVVGLALGLGCDPTPGAELEEVPRCAATQPAWVLAADDARAADWLAGACFTARPLPLTSSPAALRGLVVLGSDAAELPEYVPYMQRHADELARFVAAGGVLLQLGQSPDSEAAPPFLPAELAASREVAAAPGLQVLAPEHPLLAGAPVADGALAWRVDPGAAFVGWPGFTPLLASEAGAALLAGAHGAGQVLLTTLRLDAPAGVDAERDAFAGAFYAGLAELVAEASSQAPPTVDPTRGPPPYEEGSSLLVVLPDTQYYSESQPALFEAQTAWIARNAAALDIRHVFHLGDIVEHNNLVEWSRARGAMAQLQGVVPYALATGNHDHGPGGDASTRETDLEVWFPYATAAAAESFGGAYAPGELANTYHLFEAGGRDWIAVVLEWAPRDAVVAWADAVMREHPDRLAIFVTHAYLDSDGRRFDHADATRPQPYNPHAYPTPGPLNDGEQLWQKLVRRHRFVLTLSGHALGDGVGYLASTTDLGTTCHQLTSNYQMRPLGGEGYLRTLELRPDGETIVVRTYSPARDRYLTGAEDARVLRIDGDGS